jgi:hypothetical protein
VECNEEKKRFTVHTVKTVQSLYVNTRIKIDKGTLIDNKEIYIDQ